MRGQILAFCVRRKGIHMAPTPETKQIRSPAWLSAEAKKVWRRLAPDLIEKKVLTAWDIDTFGQLCSLIVLNQQAHADLSSRGIVIQGRHRSGVAVLVKNPSFQIARETGAEIRALAGKFGLTPSDRSQLNVGSSRSGDPKDRFLSS